MRVILISNQLTKEGIGNPVIYNMKNELANQLGSKNVSAITIKLLPTYSDVKFINKHDIIHVHFGGFYSFILGLFIWKKKIITFHGTDIHAKTNAGFLIRLKAKINQFFSIISIFLYHKVGFVSESLKLHLNRKIVKFFSHKFFINRLGVNPENFPFYEKQYSKQELRWQL